MSDAASECKALLEELKRLSRRSDGTDFDKVEALRRKVRTKVSDSLVTLTSLEDSIEDGMWRYCYYKQIEKYRTRVSDSVSDTEKRQAVGELVHFLDNSSAQYSSLLSRLDPSKHAKSMYRSLLYLGDLARYREMYSDEQGKSFQAAERLYRRCVTLGPWNGWAHNQLAVISQSRGDLCSSLAQYIRAIYAKEPFPNAKRNAELLGEVAAKQLNKIKGSGPVILAGPLSRKQRTQMLKDLLIRFVYLQSLLASGKDRLGKYDSQPSHDELIQRVRTELPPLLRKWAVSRELLLSMVICSIYSVTEASKRNLPTKMAAQKAFFMLLSIFCELLSPAPTSSGGASSSTSSSFGIDSVPANASLPQKLLGRPDLLAPISICLEWIQQSTNSGCPVDLRAPCVEPLWTALGSAWSSLLTLGQTFNDTQAQQQKQLWEEHELAGFRPAGEQDMYPRHEGVDLSTVLDSDCDEAAIARAFKVCCFCDWVANDHGLGARLPFDPPRMRLEEEEVGPHSAMSAAKVLLEEPHSSHEPLSPPWTLSPARPSIMSATPSSSVPPRAAAIQFQDEPVSLQSSQPNQDLGGEDHEDNEEENEDEEDIIVLAPQLMESAQPPEPLPQGYSFSSVSLGGGASLGAASQARSPFLSSSFGSGFSSPPTSSMLHLHLGDDQKNSSISSSASTSSSPPSIHQQSFMMDQVYGGAFPSALASPGTFAFGQSELSLQQQRPQEEPLQWGAFSSTTVTANDSSQPSKSTSSSSTSERLVSPADFLNAFSSGQRSQPNGDTRAPFFPPQQSLPPPGFNRNRSPNIDMDYNSSGRKGNF